MMPCRVVFVRACLLAVCECGVFVFVFGFLTCPNLDSCFDEIRIIRKVLQFNAICHQVAFKGEQGDNLCVNYIRYIFAYIHFNYCRGDFSI